MKSMFEFIFRCVGYGGAFASIVYFMERKNTLPTLIEDVIAFSISIVGMICLALSAEFNEVP